MGDGGNNLFTLFKLKKGEYTKKQQQQLNDISDSVSVCVRGSVCPDGCNLTLQARRVCESVAKWQELSAQPHPTGSAWRFYSIRMLPATTPPHPPAVVKSNS